MAGDRFKCIDDKIYVYNRENSINDDKVGNISQGTIEEHIRTYIKPYKRIQKPEPRVLSSDDVDIICLTGTQDIDLINSLTQQLKSNLQNSGTVHVINAVNNNNQSLSEKLLNICNLSTDYICMVNNLEQDRVPVVDLMEIKKMLWKTQAETCYLGSQAMQPSRFEQLTKNIVAFQPSQNATFTQNLNDNIQVLKTNLFKAIVKQVPLNNIASLKNHLKQSTATKRVNALSLLKI